MEKKKIVISSITVAVLLVLVVASSYAYFQARIASSGQTSTSVGAKTLDSFVINTGKDISLIANQDNFALGKGDLSSSTTATVTFTARNDEASSYAYNARFYITKNEFAYSILGNEDKGYGTAFDYHYNDAYYETGLFALPRWDNDPWDYNWADNTQSVILQTNKINLNLYVAPYSSSCKNVNAALINKVENYFYAIFYNENNVEVDRIGASQGEVLSNLKANWNSVDNLITGEHTVIRFTMSKYIPQATYVKFVIDYSECGYYFYAIDKDDEIGSTITGIPYIQGIPELELTIKKNGEVVGTYDITNASSDAYIHFKEYDEDEANKVYINAGNQCIMSGLVQIDPVKYATIEACGDDIDCGWNAHQEIVNACNGDEECENLIYADIEQLYPTCEGEAQKVVGYEISANAGATTTDTWEATVTFKNLDGNQNVNIGKSFEGYFVINSPRDANHSAHVKCMQKWYPSLDDETDYDTFENEICNGDNSCRSQFAERVYTCYRLWGSY